MAVVLNERAWTEEMMSSRSLGKKPYETLCRVARYYIDKGFSKKNTRHMLDVFLLQCDPSASLPRWSAALDNAYSWAVKHELVSIEKVVVTKPELEKIMELSGRQVQRLAFTLLCLAKYWNTVTKRSDGWVNNKDSDIMRMANINTSIKRQSLMYHNLREAGMIEFSRKIDNTNVRVCFLEDGEPEIVVTDFRNLGHQFLMYNGGPYFVCARCGLTERVSGSNRGRKQRYCKRCAAELVVQNRINYSMRHAEEKKYRVYVHEFPDGRVYVGSTSQRLRDRWKNGAGYRGSKVDEAIQDAGWENVRHYIVYEGYDSAVAKNAEAYMIQKRKASSPEYGYNSVSKALNESDEGLILSVLTSREVDGNGIAI